MQPELCSSPTSRQKTILLSKVASRGGKPDVGEDGVIEEDCVLWDHSHACPQRLLSDIPQVLAINPDAACCGVIKAEEQPQAG